MNPSNDFAQKGYCIVKQAISKELRDIATQYALFDEMQDFIADKAQVENAHAKYADPLTESILLLIQNKIEKITSLSLAPTYSFFRVYRPGDELKVHKDRTSCEISATLFLNDNEMVEHWPIFMSGERVDLEPGDMAVYRGCELEHYRKKMLGSKESWHVQTFLHYVDTIGPFAEWTFDKRKNIGELKQNPHSWQQQLPRYVERTKHD